MKWKRMGVLSLNDQRFTLQTSKDSHHHGHIIEEIPGLIKVYKDGQVERPPAVIDVPYTWQSDPNVVSKDVIINHSTGLWARLHIPKQQQGQSHRMLIPLLVYFHGGGFCVGSASWKCYHEFLARLSAHTNCLVMSVNYRLSPENRIPAAYEDGIAAVRWLRQQQSSVGAVDELKLYWRYCDFNRIFLSGDSAGANIAYNVALSLGYQAYMRGVILIQPFFGGEARTASEKSSVQSSRSALSLTTSDCYWRLALPPGCNRDHPWCNPLSNKKLEEVKIPPLLVCISELDILRDRNLEFCKAMRRASKSVEQAVYAGVGHAFQVLHNYHMSQIRTYEMLTHVKAFINSR